MNIRSVCITFTVFLIIVLTVAGITVKTENETREYLRIHIRADSNDPQAQAVKYRVKDAVVEFLTPLIAECDTREKAEKMLGDNLADIEKAANETLSRYGFDYTAKASVRTEEFPTRSYGEFVLEKGFYRALILELGSGKGDNWWCVVYPPLCFTDCGGRGYVYRSKILEIINKFKGDFDK
ncbi:MAG: stage II sporulation protein R [Clostridia bacterium]|nr:stage II sporulation protein R [Clostridia bacterium]